ncbi:unnamed protein product [Prunus brigantina]
MQRLLPVGIRHLLPEDVVKPIILLSRFFSQLTAKTLRKTDMFQLRHDIVQVLCKFEMIFPPAFFTSMMHVMVHLPEEALLAGPVNYRWMYPIERLLGELKKSVRNRAKPEGSIVEAWVQYESLTFCGMYLKDVETVFNRPQRNHGEGMRNEKLSVFAQNARPFGDPGRGESFSRNDMEVAHWFVLNNCDEIMGYLYEHEEMMKREHPSHLVAQKHCELFPQWFLLSVNKLKSSNSPTYSDELYNLAFGPIRAELFSGCNVNGVKFLGVARDDKLCTQNSGVHVPGGGESTDIDFYGKLTTVVQLLYKDRYQVILFKCRWFDTNPNRPGSVKIDYGLLSVNMNRTWYDDDPYILANMATQIVYLDDPKAGSGWNVVQKMDHRNVYAVPELDPTDNDVDNVADQRLESSMENDGQTLRDTNVTQEPFQIQGVSSIEIPIQSITIDLGHLPRYDDAVGPSNDDDVVIEEAEEEEEEEEDWETESDDSDDNENPAATGVEPWSFSAVAVHPAAVISSVYAESSPPLFSLLRSPNPAIEMSDLITRRRAVTTTPSSEPPPQPVSDATAPALMEQDHVLASPGGSQAPASSASSVVQPLSARRRHRPASTTETTSTDGTGASGAPPAKRNTRGPCRQLKTAKVTRVTNSRISIAYDKRHRAAPTAELHSSLAHDIGHVVRTHCLMQWKSWKVMPDEIKLQVRGQLSTNYHLEDLNEESMAYVNRLFGERYKQWKSDLHHHFQAFDDPQVALQEGCPKELEGREDSWAWLCAHFQAPDYVGGRNSQRSTSSVTFMFDLGMSWSSPFIRRWWRGASWFFKSPPPNFLPRLRSSLWILRMMLDFRFLTQTLDQTLGRRPGTYCRGWGMPDRGNLDRGHRRRQTVK